MSMNIRNFFPVILLFTLVLFFTSCTEKKQQALSEQLNSPSITTNESLNSEQKISASKIMLDVYKDPNCGCCSEWITHIEDQGFAATAHDTDAMAQIKMDKGVPSSHQSCHTAVSKEGFVFEGHVPAKFIAQFLAEKPAGAFGLTVPAMPIGSPGMEMGERFMAYKVFQLNTEGEPTVFAEVNSYAEQF
jgi:hypothetical protein